MTESLSLFQRKTIESPYSLHTMEVYGVEQPDKTMSPKLHSRHEPASILSAGISGSSSALRRDVLAQGHLQNPTGTQRMFVLPEMRSVRVLSVTSTNVWCGCRGRSSVGFADAVTTAASTSTSTIATEGATTTTAASTARFAITAGCSATSRLITTSAFAAASLAYTAPATPSARTQPSSRRATLEGCKAKTLELFKCLLGRASLEHLLHDFCRFEVSDPGSFRCFLHVYHFGGVLGREKDRFDLVRAVHIVHVGDENSSRWFLLW